MVFASMPVASDIRFAALPVGAAKIITHPACLYAEIIPNVVVVLPVPGPPVNTITLDEMAVFTACH